MELISEKTSSGTLKALEVVFQRARAWGVLDDQSENPSKASKMRAVFEVLAYRNKPRNRSWGPVVEIFKRELPSDHPACGPFLYYQLADDHPRRKRFVSRQSLKRALGRESGIITQAKRRTLSQWQAWCAENPERIKRAKKRVAFRKLSTLWKWATGRKLFKTVR